MLNNPFDNHPKGCARGESETPSHAARTNRRCTRKPLDHMEHPVRMIERLLQVGLLARGSPPVPPPSQINIQWDLVDQLTNHSCGGSFGLENYSVFRIPFYPNF